MILTMRFGSQPWATEHNAAGDLLWAARYPEGVQAYRMVRAYWTGAPHTEPSIYVSTSPDNNTAQTYISWNGDSRVSQWRVYASQDNSSSSDPMTFDKAGFETLYEFTLDWPEGVESMYVRAEGMSGDQVVGTTRQVMIQRDGQGGSVSDQSGVGSGGSGSNSSSNSTTGDSDAADSTPSNDGANAASILRSSGAAILVGFMGLVLVV
jgi:hypothetical protein